MHSFFAIILLLLICLCLLTSYIAEWYTAKQYEPSKKFDKGDKTFVSGFSIIVVFLTVMLFFTYRDLRDHTIKEYLSGEIVEQVTYKTKKQGGVEVRRDSTITYVRAKNQK